MSLAPPTLADLTERGFASQFVYPLVKLCGFKRYHTWRSKHSPAGYPDETLVRERLVMLELKAEGGKLSAAQKEWIRALLTAGVETYVVRPRDLGALAKVLAARAPVWDSSFGAAPDALGAHLALREQTVRETEPA